MIGPPAASRGRHPDDERLFAPPGLTAVRLAAEEASWMVDRGYAEATVLPLVNERHSLEPRQRLAVERALCSAAQYRRRASREIDAEDVARRPLRIDTRGLLCAVEVAIGGGPLVRSLDGSLFHLESSDRVGREGLLPETPLALARIMEAVRALRPSVARFYLADSEPSPPGLEDLRSARAGRGAVSIELARAPAVAPRLVGAGQVVSADRAVLDACASWFNLGAAIVRSVPAAWVVALDWL